MLIPAVLFNNNSRGPAGAAPRRHVARIIRLRNQVGPPGGRRVQLSDGKERPWDREASLIPGELVTAARHRGGGGGERDIIARCCVCVLRESPSGCFGG